jgi:hypothetical protein
MRDRNVDDVIRKLRQRSQVGQQQYGVTTDGASLTFVEWMRHLQEELLDASVYIQQVMRLLKESD